jgi:hypothetical protein
MIWKLNTLWQIPAESLVQPYELARIIHGAAWKMLVSVD